MTPVGLGLPFEKDKLTTAFSPQNFVLTKTYGIAPSNTTLTVRYLTGGGVGANVPANTISNINSNVQFINSNLNSSTAQIVFNSLAVNNPAAADGGGMSFLQNFSHSFPLRTLVFNVYYLNG